MDGVPHQNESSCIVDNHDSAWKTAAELLDGSRERLANLVDAKPLTPRHAFTPVSDKRPESNHIGRFPQFNTYVKSIFKFSTSARAKSTTSGAIRHKIKPQRASRQHTFIKVKTGLLGSIPRQGRALDGAQTKNPSNIAVARVFEWWPGADSIHRHADFQSAALPTELPGHKNKIIAA